MSDPLPTWSVELLSASHDHRNFDCGNAAMNTFLQRFALRNNGLGVAQSYAAVAPGSRVVEGYYSVSAGRVASALIPDELKKGLPRYPVPVALIGRLAVDRHRQGLGLGRMLLVDALRRILKLSREIGIHAIEVDAIDEVAQRFYSRYGFVPLLDDPRHLYLQLASVRKLGLR